MKSVYKLGILFLVIANIVSCTHIESKKDIIFQESTIDALLAANYKGTISYGRLKNMGDIGIGTFDQLDGEMIALDGEFYQIKSDSKVYPVSDDMTTPFAAVSFFDSDIKKKLNGIDDYHTLEQVIDEELPTKNIFYVLKVTGRFKKIKVRSVPKQKKPYRSLIEVVKRQPVYEFENVEGTLVGFRCPAYAKGINVVGYHFHFIDKDKAWGGHVLECAIEHAFLEIDNSHEFSMSLPGNQNFYQTDLERDKTKELEKVEK